jgi:hypothetical protein
VTCCSRYSPHVLKVGDEYYVCFIGATGTHLAVPFGDLRGQALSPNPPPNRAFAIGSTLINPLSHGFGLQPDSLSADNPVVIHNPSVALPADVSIGQVGSVVIYPLFEGKQFLAFRGQSSGELIAKDQALTTPVGHVTNGVTVI